MARPGWPGNAAAIAYVEWIVAYSGTLGSISRSLAASGAGQEAQYQEGTREDIQAVTQQKKSVRALITDSFESSIHQHGSFINDYKSQSLKF